MDSLVSSPKIDSCDERAGPKPNAASKRINVRPTLARPESPATGTARAAATPNPAVFQTLAISAPALLLIWLILCREKRNVTHSGCTYRAWPYSEGTHRV